MGWIENDVVPLTQLQDLEAPANTECWESDSKHKKIFTLAPTKYTHEAEFLIDWGCNPKESCGVVNML